MNCTPRKALSKMRPDDSDKYGSYGTTYHAQCPTAPAPVVSITAAELRIAADEMEAREVVASAKAAVQAQLRYDIELATATKFLLVSICNALRIGCDILQVSDQLCTFRKALQPLAESYGFRIIVVGDRTKATLVVV